MTNLRDSDDDDVGAIVASEAAAAPDGTAVAIETAKENIGAELVDIVTIRAVKQVSNILFGVIGAAIIVAGWLGFDAYKSRQDLMAQVEKDIASIDERIRPLSLQIAAFEKDIKAMQEGAEEVEDHHQRVQDLLTSLKTDMGEIETKMSAFSGKFELVNDAKSRMDELYFPVLAQLHEQRSNIADIEHTVQSNNSDYHSVKAAISRELSQRAEHVTVTLPNNRESQFGPWPIRVSIGRNRSGALDRVVFRDLEGNDLSVHHDVTANGTPIEVSQDSARYEFHFSNIRFGGLLQRSSVINGTRTSLVLLDESAGFAQVR